MSLGTYALRLLPRGTFLRTTSAQLRCFADGAPPSAPAAPAAGKEKQQSKGEAVVPPPSQGKRKPWKKEEVVRLLRLAEMLEQYSITGDQTPFSFVPIPKVTSWQQLATFMPGRGEHECKKKFREIEDQSFMLGTSPFNYHPLSMFPSPPSPQQKRRLLSYIYNYLTLRGEIPVNSTHRRANFDVLESHLRSIHMNFYYRRDTFRRIVEVDGAPFFTVEGDYIIQKPKIPSRQFAQISHLAIDRTKVEAQINSLISGYLREKSLASISELKSHLLVFARLSEAYFELDGDLPSFLEKDLYAQKHFEVFPNEDNPYDNWVRIKRMAAQAAPAAPATPAAPSGESGDAEVEAEPEAEAEAEAEAETETKTK